MFEWTIDHHFTILTSHSSHQVQFFDSMIFALLGMSSQLHVALKFTNKARSIRYSYRYNVTLNDQEV